MNARRSRAQPWEPGAIGGGDEQLPEPGHHRAGSLAEELRGHRDVPPAEYDQALLGRQLVHPTGDVGHGLVVVGQERRADRVFTPWRKGELTNRPEEPVGHLEQHAGAVTGVGFAAGSAAMIEITQSREGMIDDLVARLTAQGRYECDTAGIVLEPWIVQAVRRRGRSAHVETPVVVLAYERSIEGRRWPWRLQAGYRMGSNRPRDDGPDPIRVGVAWPARQLGVELPT